MVIIVGYPAREPKTIPDRKAKVELFLVRVRPEEAGMGSQHLLTNTSKKTFISAIVAILDPTIYCKPSAYSAFLTALTY